MRDLVCLFDDLSVLRRQIAHFVDERKAAPEGEKCLCSVEFLKNLGDNMDHAQDFLLEVMSRMEVARLDPSPGKLNKKSQRAISVELADSPEEDGEIVRSVKPGFSWRERIVRPEEVVVKKWKEGFLVAMSGNSQK